MGKVKSKLPYLKNLEKVALVLKLFLGSGKHFLKT